MSSRASTIPARRVCPRNRLLNEIALPLLVSSFAMACGGATNGDDKDASLESGRQDAHVDGGAQDTGVREGSIADATSTAAIASCNAINMALIRRYVECDGRPAAFGLAFETLGFVEYGSGSSSSDSMLTDLEYECSRVGPDVVAGKIRFDRTKLAACESEIKAFTCNYLYGAVVNLPDTCNAVLSGTVTVGRACRLSQECAGNEEQCDDTSRCPGTCVGVPSSVTLECRGDGGPASVCSVEQGCDEATGKCVPRWKSGPCSTSVDCAGGYQCTHGGPAADASSYGCVAYERAGDACTVGASECSPGTFCSSGKCAVWPGVGGACGDILGETVGCLDGTCTASGSDGKGMCIARLPAGSNCTLRDGQSNPCAPGASCIAGSCTSLECF